MKTLNIRALVVSGIMSVTAMAFNAGLLSAQPATTVSDASMRFQKEKSDISRDIANISFQRENIKNLEEKYKKDKDTDDEALVLMDKKHLRKASADLRKNKAYLRADKMDLIDDHNLAISERKKMIKDTEYKRDAARKILNRNLANGEENLASKNAAGVAQYEQELKNNKESLRNEKILKNDDILAINKEIERTNGQYTALLRTENAVAVTKNKAVK